LRGRGDNACYSHKSRAIGSQGEMNQAMPIAGVTRGHIQNCGWRFFYCPASPSRRPSPPPPVQRRCVTEYVNIHPYITSYHNRFMRAMVLQAQSYNNRRPREGLKALVGC